MHQARRDCFSPVPTISMSQGPMGSGSTNGGGDMSGCRGHGEGINMHYISNVP